MPLFITRIEPQKRKKNRYSLFAGSEFIISVSDKTLLEFGLNRGYELSEESLEKIRQKENYDLIYEQALRYLARRAHAKFELQQKLKHKGHDIAQIAKIISELEKKRYLNDFDFSRIFIQDEITLRQSGPLRIQQKLIKKGVSRDVFTDLIHQMYPEELQFKNALHLCHKKLNTFRRSDSVDVQKKLAAYLKNKGYIWSVSERVIRTITGELANETSE